MATNYEMDFTDGNDSRTFQLAPYTTNGYLNPTSATLDGNASGAATSLLLYGKGSPDYGERIQENLLHAMEHFASDVEPVAPIPGQVWYDRSVTPNQLRVYNPNKHLFSYVNTANVTIVGDHEDRFYALSSLGRSVKIRINDGAVIADAVYSEFFIVNAVYTTTTQITFDPSTPLTPSIHNAGTWYIGGWDLIVQTGSTLEANLNAGGFKIVNVLAPSTGTDAANKDYVDSTAAALNELSELADVVLSSTGSPQVVGGSPLPLTNREIITWDSATGKWINSDGLDTFLGLAGGTLTGSVDMSLNTITNVRMTIGTLTEYDGEAATKTYVDDQITLVSGGTPTVLDSLTDVTYGTVGSPAVTTLATDDILSFNGSTWTNKTPAALASDNGFFTTTGGTLTGVLTLFGNPLSGLDAVPKQYVDNAIGFDGAGVGVGSPLGLNVIEQSEAYTDAQLLALTDVYVDGGSYSSGTDILTLTRNGDADVTIAFPTAGLTVTDLVDHTILDPNTDQLLIDNLQGGAFLEEKFGTDANYPTIGMNDIVSHLNVMLGRFVGGGKQRFTFTSTADTTIYLDDTSGGLMPDQANPIAPLNYYYHVGTHNLSVYVNGAKQYVSDPGYRSIYSDDLILMRGTRTGLSAGSPITTYSFDITVNGGTPTTVTINGVATMGELVDAINAVADTNYWQSGSPTNADYAFGCTLYGGLLQFYSGIPGTGSSIDITDTDLFVGLVGDAASTGAFTVVLPIDGGSPQVEPIGPDANYPPTTLDYSEVGRFGQPGQRIVFDSALVAGTDIVEVIIEPNMYGDIIL